MEAREYLGQLRRIKTLIRNKAETISELRAMAVNISAPFSENTKVQASGRGSKVEYLVCQYVDMEHELQNDIARLAQTQLEIVQTLEKLPNREYDFLHKYYFQGLTLQDIASIYDRSYSWATTTHYRALLHLQAVLDAG